MRSFLAAIAFLTRIPVGRLVEFDAKDVARSAGWFPLTGILLGALYCLAAAVVRANVPSAVAAVLLVILDGLATGALHYDALADTADGFGGGKTSDDVLRIMRDHAIGSYGGFALATVVALKVTTYAALLNQANWAVALIAAPALGRWSILLFTTVLPYARASESVIGGMKMRSLAWGTPVIFIGLLAARSLRAWIAAAVVLAVTAAFGWYCRRRIGGITGDTVGANLQLCECAALLTFVWTASPR